MTILTRAAPRGVRMAPRANASEVARIAAEIRANIEANHSAISDTLAGFDNRMIELEQRMDRGSSARSGTRSGAANWGTEVIMDESFRAMSSGKPGKARIGIQAAITTDNSSAGGLIPTDHRTEPTRMVQRPPTILDLISIGRTSSNAVTVVRQTGRTNNSRFVSEGATKPESDLSFTPETIPVLTLAHWLTASVQALDDASMLSTLIDNELRYGLQVTLEDEILMGDGTSQHFSGLVPNAATFNPPYVVSGASPLDVILQARAQLSAANYTATGVVLNAVDWAEMIGERGSDDHFISGGPFVSTPPTLWGMPVVATTALDQGEFLIGDFRRAATLYQRQDATIEVSTEHSDYFARNLVAIRGELRAALAINDGNALVAGSF